ncbi:hypothetical protein HYFRA_00008403 [Hymenoscyphus fraxineus]|uniref:Pyridoxamine 5'-phosphate oxidase N-terminal domain-containing protein n=1 Tax=Hymenoscyphus fraxineus TaxID=746836 RepID=A0A9N9PKP9_9HELO|nr:hypothetical protein HYFRA_00008403 [Hymenoscyphus fraxineus]
MPQFYPEIPPHLQTFALSQPLFFISSAPTHGSHINLSPKGLPSTTFTIFSPTECAYIDATGSGAETISHLYENGRATIMFCSFSASPRIVRFFCTGRVVEWDTPEFQVLVSKMGKKKVEGARAVLLFKVWKAQSSCGYGVPRINPQLTSSSSTPPNPSSPSTDTPTSPSIEHQDEEKAAFLDREILGHWASKQIEKNELGAYQIKNNLSSLDGLPGLKTARREAGQNLLFVDFVAFCKRVLAQREGLMVGLLMGFLIYVFGVFLF